MSEPRRRPHPYAVTVRRTEQLSASLVRVVVGGASLGGFTPSPYADSYVKTVFVHPDSPRPLPRTPDGRVDLETVRAALPPEQAPRIRSYTVRGFDPVALELTLDFVVHGDAGVAGPWAATARPGDELHWRSGVDDEGWRAAKRDWNVAIEQAEAAVTGVA